MPRTSPIVGFSTLMLAPELIRIQRAARQLGPPAKVNAIRGEFMRQCDTLDASPRRHQQLHGGVAPSSTLLRASADVTRGREALPHQHRSESGRHDRQRISPPMADALSSSRYSATPSPRRSHTGRRHSGCGCRTRSIPRKAASSRPRFQGAGSATETSSNHSHLGVLPRHGFPHEELTANPLDYVEGGTSNRRREELSLTLARQSRPACVREARRQDMVTIGTNDTLASPGAQLDYYEAMLDKMSRRTVDRFAACSSCPSRPRPQRHELQRRRHRKTDHPAPIPISMIGMRCCSTWL